MTGNHEQRGPGRDADPDWEWDAAGEDSPAQRPSTSAATIAVSSAGTST